MYLRIKKRKQGNKVHQYAYLVQSKRRKRSRKPPKQKVVAYLGKVILLKENKVSELNNTLEACKSFSETILEALKDLLLANKFSKVSEDLFEKEDLQIDFKQKTVQNKQTSKNICLQVNEGFLSSYTLKEILDYKPPEDLEKAVGRHLAKKLLSVGLRPSEALFLKIYGFFSKSSTGNEGVHQQ